LIAAGGWTDKDPPDHIYLFSRSGVLIKRIEGLPNVVLHLTFSREGRYLAAGLYGTNGIRIYDRQRDWGESARDGDYGDAVYGLDFAGNGRLATTSRDGKVRLYDRTFARIAQYRTQSAGQPDGIAFYPIGGRLPVGLND